MTINFLGVSSDFVVCLSALSFVFCVDKSDRHSDISSLFFGEVLSRYSEFMNDAWLGQCGPCSSKGMIGSQPYDWFNQYLL